VAHGRLEEEDNATHSDAEVEAVACTEAEDEAVVWSRAGIEDGRRWWHDGF
jgi:hypothetical protein